MMNAVEFGEIVDDRYTLLESLGEGGMGTVFRAQELGLERSIALKLLLPSLLTDKEARLRFEREGRVLSALSHINLPVFYRFGIWNGIYPYIAMELLEGRTLRQILDDEGSLPPERLLDIAVQVCSGMDWAHKAGIIHRDLKPSNIMLAESHIVNRGQSARDTAKILDFGLARLSEQGSRHTQHLTQTGEIIGTAFYMSPEQCVGKPADERSDVYALGCIMFETLTGHPPFVADNPLGLMHMHVNDSLPAVERACNRKLPDGLASVIAKAMAKDPNLRYQSMAELHGDLTLIRVDRGGEITRSIEQLAAQKPVVRSNKLVLLCGALALMILAIALAQILFPAVESTPVLAEPRPTRTIAANLKRRTPEEQLVTCLRETSALPGDLAEGLAVLTAIMDKAEDAFAKFPKSNKTLMFQGHLTLSNIYYREIQYRKRMQKGLSGADARRFQWLLDKCEEQNRAALSLMKKADGTYSNAAVVAFNKLADIASERDDEALCVSCYRQALKLAEQPLDDQFLKQANPRLVGCEWGASVSYMREHLAHSLIKAGDLKLAESLLRDSLQNNVRMRGRMRSELLRVSIDLVSLLRKTGREGEATKVYETARGRFDKDVASGLINQREQAEYLILLAELDLVQGDCAKALRTLSQALDIMDGASRDYSFTHWNGQLYRILRSDNFLKSPKTDAMVSEMQTRYDHLLSVRNRI